jgi:hypothetical protein
MTYRIAPASSSRCATALRKNKSASIDSRPPLPSNRMITMPTKLLKAPRMKKIHLTRKPRSEFVPRRAPRKMRTLAKTSGMPRCCALCKIWWTRSVAVPGMLRLPNLCGSLMAYTTKASRSTKDVARMAPSAARSAGCPSLAVMLTNTMRSAPYSSKDYDGALTSPVDVRRRSPFLQGEMID